jgi:hypothetical protein
MEVSMDGLRKSLSRDISYLKSLVIAAANMQLRDKDELFEAMNQVIQDSNILNCVYNNDDDSFTDLSDVRVDPIETED